MITNFVSGSIQDTLSFFSKKSLIWRIMFVGIPLFSASLLLVFFLTCEKIQQIITTAIARNEQMHAEALAHSLEKVLLEARNQLRVLAAGSTSKEDMLARISLRTNAGSPYYREIAFISNVSNERYVLLNINNEIIDIPPQIINNTVNSPFQFLEADLKPGVVRISAPMETTYNMVEFEQKWHNITLQIIRISTPIFDDSGKPTGMMLLSFDLKVFRDILSKESTIFSVVEEGNNKTLRSMFFDYYGWILFQSEEYNENTLKDLPLRSDDIRSGLKGDVGRKGFTGAFRPSVEYTLYQEMIEHIKEGRSGHIYLPKKDSGFSAGQMHAECVSFAPVQFSTSATAPNEIIGGIGILDTSFASSNAFNHIIHIFIFCFFFALFLVILCLWFVGRDTGKALQSVISQIRERNQTLRTDRLSVEKLPKELESLRSEIDTLLNNFRRAQDETANQLAVSNAKLLTAAAQNLPSVESIKQDFLVGTSQVINNLRKQIKKIANVNADILVVGETGTGKELVSQAIHEASSRSDKPFITINCGALDENLLMDTLFGHVKGAFTEAKQIRKGAFIAAEGGTLMLDEIGNAPPKVQQALLRALSMRNIRPLGSDQDQPFDARIIAATNADLKSDGLEGNFRNDLYYRLAVISLHTPSLRDHKEDIPALVVHFIATFLENESENETMRTISRGALKKLMNYNWPGNVRELKNVITRALAFSQKDILQAEDIVLDDSTQHVEEKTGKVSTNPYLPTKNNPSLQSMMDQLNSRQQSAIHYLIGQGEITRQEYQNLLTENISLR
ncbi:MAG: sigma 54-interacting transcriptional regulator, partial [Desulfovibrio sp.]|nr:sigma 54-interacting transcriptional regulator [Desulfovibrio sp.]